MRATLAILAALVLAGAAPAIAAAHITVIPAAAKPGATPALTFRVPNERDDATTVRVDLFLPPGVPADVKPHPGWSDSVGAQGEVSWSADTPDAAIKPGRTQDFAVTLGPLPKTDRIVFKGLQHYADGAIVRWIQDPGEEADRPAAVLELSGKRPGDSGSAPVGFVILGAVLLALVGGAVLLIRRLA